MTNSGLPNGAHDDQVDAMTMAIQYMRDSWNVTSEDPDWEDDVNPRRIKRVDIGEPSGIIYPLKFYLGDNNASYKYETQTCSPYGWW